ncbi:MAG: peptidylprolyl isomerase [Nitrospirae bacterium]|nr:peptidylprolyl isomerase [Nitrospirota bacterium]
MRRLKLLIIILVITVITKNAYNAILLDRVIAVVNKEVITWSELFKMMEYESTDQIKALTEEERNKVFKENEAIFLDKLIDFKLQLQEAKRLGFEVKQDEIQEAIENIKKKYSMNDTDFEESLKKEGFTLEDYKKRLSEQMLISKFLNYQIRNKVVVSEEEIKRFLEKDKRELLDSESYRIRQIFFKRPKDDDIKSIEEKAAIVIQKLNEGEDFSNLCHEYSDDPSAKTGGDLGVVKKGDLSKEFVHVISNMKTGDISKPFWTEKGLHIIKLDEIIPAPDIEKIKENVRKQLAEDIFSKRYKSLIKELREKSHIEIRL